MVGMRIGVAGHTGRMGRLVIEEVDAAGAELSGGIGRQAGPEAFDRLCADSDAVIDFTHAGTALHHARAVKSGGCAWVLGTTGLSAADQSAIAQAAIAAPVVQAANFSPGLTLLLDLARRLSASLPSDAYDAEILEMHHRDKRDSPSGTALALAHAVAAGRGRHLDELRVPPRDGDTGPRTPGTIGMASLRGGAIVGEHTLLFAGQHEQIAIRHTALDRRVFATGAVQAALWTAGRGPGLYTMRHVLGLADISGS